MQASLDIVLDIETTGTSPGCCILSIGAATTDRQYEFYQTIWHASQKEVYGLQDDYDTLRWWDKQSAEARNEAFSGTMGLVSALGKFSDWVQSLPAKDKFFWGNGSDFDQPILAYAYKAVDMKNPFGFNNRCYRTLKNLYPNVKAPTDFEGIKHHALWDAKHEAKHLSMLLQYHFNNLAVRPQPVIFQD